MPGKIASSLSTYFTNLGTSINENSDSLFAALPDGIKDSLSSLFTNLGTSIDNVGTGIDSVQDSVDNVKTGITNLPGKIASSLSTYFTKLGTSINENSNSLFAALPDGIKDSLSSFFTNLGTGINNVKTSIETMSDKFDAFNTSALADINALVTGQKDIFTDVSGLKTHVSDLLASMINLPANIRDNLKSSFEELGSLFDDGLVGLPGNIASSLSSFFTALPSGIATSLSSHFDSLGNLVDFGFSLLPDDIKVALDPLFGSVTSGITALSDKFTSVGNLLTDLPQAIRISFSDAFTDTFVPSEEYMSDYKLRLEALLSEKLGALYQCVDLVRSYFQNFGNIKASKALEFPHVSVPFIGTTFEFGGWSVPLVPAGFENILTYLKLGINFVAIGLFLNGMNTRVNRLFGVR